MRRYFYNFINKEDGAVLTGFTLTFLVAAAVFALILSSFIAQANGAANQLGKIGQEILKLYHFW